MRPKYQARYVLRDKFNRVRNRRAAAGCASGLPVLLMLIGIAYWQYWLPVVLIAVIVFIIVKIAKKQKRKKAALGPPPPLYGAYGYQPPSPPPMTGHDFEHYCANILRQNGYTNVQVTKASGDNGVDVIAERDGIRHAIQTKYYNGTVGNDAVQQVHAGRAMYQCAVGIVMTNSTFTKSAAETAARLGIVLWDGNRLNLMAAKARAAQQPPPAPPAPPPQWAGPQPYYQPPGQPPYWAAPQVPAPPKPEICPEKPPTPPA